MAVSDWTFLSSGAAAQNAVSYNLAGPITPPNGTSGAYARSIVLSAASSRAGFVPSNPAFTGVPVSKAIRVQSFAYRVDTGVFASWFFLAAKCNSSNPVGTGYSFGTRNQSNYGLTFLAPNFSITLTPSTPPGVWLSLRMTVYPVGPTIDRVICEQESSPGSGVWSSTFANGSGDFTIDQSVTPSIYVPWGGATVNGVFAHFVSGGGVPQTTLFDMTQVSLATAPVPIP